MRHAFSVGPTVRGVGGGGGSLISSKQAVEFPQVQANLLSKQ